MVSAAHVPLCSFPDGRSRASLSAHSHAHAPQAQWLASPYEVVDVRSCAVSNRTTLTSQRTAASSAKTLTGDSSALDRTQQGLCIPSFLDSLVHS